MVLFSETFSIDLNITGVGKPSQRMQLQEYIVMPFLSE
jgi:hypothetical protein